MKNQFLKDEYYHSWVRLSQARNTIFKARNKELRLYNITAVQGAILFAINTIKATEGEVTIVKISNWLVREHHTVSGIINRMINKGLVSKIKGSGIKKGANVILTEKGEQVYRQSLKRESIHEIMSCLSEEERQQLDSSLEKLRDKALKTLAEAHKVPFP